MTNGNGDDYSDFTLEDTGTGPTVFEKMFDAWLDDAYEEARQRRDRATMEAIERLRQQGDISRIGFEHELQFDPRLVGLSEQAAELEIKIQAAAEAGNRETQLLLLRERAKLDEEAEKAGFQRELWIRAVDQAFDAKENALNRETQLRGQAIGELGANARAFAEQQGRARSDLAATQGTDPFRSAIRQQGGIALGRTPAQGLRRDLERVAYARPPQVNLGGSIEDIFSGLQQFQNKLANPAQGQLGFAGGGEVITLGRDQYRILEDSKEPDIAGPAGIGIEVGERGKELLEIMPDRIRVIPIRARGAGGLEVQLGQPQLGTQGMGVRQTEPTTGLAVAPAPVAAPARVAPPIVQPAQVQTQAVGPPTQGPPPPVGGPPEAPGQIPPAQPPPQLGQPQAETIVENPETDYREMNDSVLVAEGARIMSEGLSDPTRSQLLLLQIADELDRRGIQGGNAAMFRSVAAVLADFQTGLRSEDNARGAIEDIAAGRPPRTAEGPGSDVGGPGDLRNRNESLLVADGAQAMADGLQNPARSSQLLLQIAAELDRRGVQGQNAANFRAAAQVLQEFQAGLRTEDNARGALEDIGAGRPPRDAEAPGEPGPGPPGPEPPPPEPPPPFVGGPGGPFTPAQTTFIENLLAEWPPSIEEAFTADNMGLSVVKDIIQRYVAGLMNDAEAREALLNHLYGGGDATTVLTDFQFAERFAELWPNVDIGAWAQAAGERGLTDMQALLIDYLSNRMSRDELALALRDIFPGLRIPGATGNQNFDPAVMRQAIATLWRHLGFEGGDVTAGYGALGEVELNAPQFGPGNISALSEQDRTWVLQLSTRIIDPNYRVSLVDINDAQARGMVEVQTILRMLQNGDIDAGQARDRILTWLQDIAGRNVADVYKRMGVAPKLYRNADRGEVYVLVNGQLRQVSSEGLASGAELSALGLDQSQIVDMPWNQLSQIAPLGAPMQAGENMEQFLGAIQGSDQPFALMASPLIEPVTGAVLPAPRTIAAIINKLDPTVRELILTAYESAGLGRESLFRESNWFTPTGTFSGQQAMLG